MDICAADLPVSPQEHNTSSNCILLCKKNYGNGPGPEFPLSRIKQRQLLHRAKALDPAAPLFDPLHQVLFHPVRRLYQGRQVGKMVGVQQGIPGDGILLPRPIQLPLEADCGKKGLDRVVALPAGAVLLEGGADLLLPGGQLPHLLLFRLGHSGGLNSGDVPLPPQRLSQRGHQALAGGPQLPHRLRLDDRRVSL